MYIIMIKEKDILKAIKAARIEKNLKQEYIAVLIGEHRTNYSKKERGKVPMTLKDLEKISDILSLDLSNLSSYLPRVHQKKILLRRSLPSYIRIIK